MPMSNHSGQNNVMIQLHGMQGSQGPFGNSMYGNNAMPNNNILDQWYYEDPEVWDYCNFMNISSSKYIFFFNNFVIFAPHRR